MNKRWRKILGLPPEAQSICDYQWETIRKIRDMFTDLILVDSLSLVTLYGEFSASRSASWLIDSDQTLSEFKAWCDELV